MCIVALQMPKFLMLWRKVDVVTEGGLSGQLCDLILEEAKAL